MAKVTGFGLATLIIVLWGAAYFVYAGNMGGDVAASDYPLPASDLPTLESQQSEPALNANASNQPSFPDTPFLLNFWASWCVTCQTENKFLHAISGEVPIVGIALKDSPESAARWLEKFGSPFDLSLIDAEGHYAEELGVQGAPETFLVDGHGNVRFHYQGLLQETVWEQRVQPLLDSLRASSGH